MSDETDALLQERASNWGDPVLTHARIAQVWSGILDHDVTPHQVALCMVGLKLVRADLNPDNSDSLDDAAGYVRIGQQITGSWSSDRLADLPVPYQVVDGDECMKHMQHVTTMRHTRDECPAVQP